MPGHFGATDRDDGVFASTTASDRSGAFFRNNSTSPPVGQGGSGIFGLTTSPGGAGVFGANNSSKGVGVQGNGPESGVRGLSESGIGVIGQSTRNSGLVGTSRDGQGVTARSDDTGLFAQGGKFAGVFLGRVSIDGELDITRDIKFVGGDCAEDFDIADTARADPGTVMVLNEEGMLRESTEAYDKRVAGVVSGAGDYKPGIVLDARGPQTNRRPIALLGKVVCKVDASYGPVEVGDLLTTSATPGCAMRATDPVKAFGAVIGKALRPLADGQASIPILIALQ